MFNHHDLVNNESEFSLKVSQKKTPNELNRVLKKCITGISQAKITSMGQVKVKHNERKNDKKKVDIGEVNTNTEGTEMN